MAYKNLQRKACKESFNCILNTSTHFLCLTWPTRTLTPFFLDLLFNLILPLRTVFCIILYASDVAKISRPRLFVVPTTVFENSIIVPGAFHQSTVDSWLTGTRERIRSFNAHTWREEWWNRELFCIALCEYYGYPLQSNPKWSSWCNKVIFNTKHFRSFTVLQTQRNNANGISQPTSIWPLLDAVAIKVDTLLPSASQSIAAQ
jgi:hypothetical protein